MRQSAVASPILVLVLGILGVGCGSGDSEETRSSSSPQCTVPATKTQLDVSVEGGATRQTLSGYTYLTGNDTLTFMVDCLPHDPQTKTTLTGSTTQISFDTEDDLAVGTYDASTMTEDGELAVQRASIFHTVHHVAALDRKMIEGSDASEYQTSWSGTYESEPSQEDLEDPTFSEDFQLVIDSAEEPTEDHFEYHGSFSIVGISPEAGTLTFAANF